MGYEPTGTVKGHNRRMSINRSHRAQKDSSGSEASVTSSEISSPSEESRRPRASARR
jgi:hypothetical protein